MGDLYTPMANVCPTAPTTLARAASLADAAMKLLLVCAPARQTMSTAPTSTLDLAATVAVVVGTGRSSRINNGTTPTNATFTEALPCCNSFPGDYCCNYLRKLSPNCAFGRIPQGPMCGVPVRGTPATLYNTRPPMPYGGAFRPPFGYPVPYMPTPMPYGIRQGFYSSPSMFYMRPPSPMMYQQFRPPVYYPPPPPMYRPPAYYPPPPPPPPYIAPPIDQKPSPYICSCDFMCVEYMDCCDDFKSYCCSNTSNASACS